MPLTVAIVGRPNVGKSTLFNRLAGRRLAIVDGTPGVTRDRRTATLVLGDAELTLVDTAGFEEAAAIDDLAARIQAQTRRAIADADLALMLVDARAGITPLDGELAALLRRAGVPVLLVANKYDGGAGHAGALEAFGLGLGEPLLVSATHGEGLGHLTDALRRRALAHGDAAPSATDAERPEITLAVVGRPNVGKSTLVNRLIGEERLITGPEAGITRDAIAVDWEHGGRRLRLIDTAGLRRRPRVEDHIEAFAAAETVRTIRTAQVCVVVVDARLGLDRQDLAIVRLVAEEGRCPVLALNKWDLIEAPQPALAEFDRRIQASLAQVRGLRRLPVSALSGRGLPALITAVIAGFDAWSRHVATGPLNRWLQEAVGRHAPPAVAGRPFKLRYITQVGTRPPCFALFANRRAELADGYLRYLAGGLRERFGFDGVPLRFVVRAAKNPYAP